jgi:hypothetical protein
LYEKPLVRRGLGNFGTFFSLFQVGKKGFQDLEDYGIRIVATGHNFINVSAFLAGTFKPGEY